ncbi:MAG: type VI secretion system lipoprotein TssJ [Gammaproteobacteria bacterium]|nr:type VI secretion system lipoprotein TssJ [Gammaproteobacteria bacterium]
MKLLFTIILIFATCVLSACASPQHKILLTTHSAEYLNPDINGKPSPLVLTLFELRSSIGFNQSSYQQLQDNCINALGNNLIDKQNIELRPGETKNIKQSITSDTRYIGLMAAYRNIQQAQWQRLVPIDQNKKSTYIEAFLESQRLITKKVIHHGLF